jgi:hypothetical protein
MDYPVLKSSSLMVLALLSREYSAAKAM